MTVKLSTGELTANEDTLVLIHEALTEASYYLGAMHRRPLTSANMKKDAEVIEAALKDIGWFD